MTKPVDFDADGMVQLINSSLRELEEKGTMSDKPREWPNVARDARDRAAEAAAEALRALEPLAGRTNDPEDIRRLLRVERNLYTILRLLEREGAPTRP